MTPTLTFPSRLSARATCSSSVRSTRWSARCASISGVGTLKEFEDMVRKDFTGSGPYPTYVLQTISEPAATSANPFPAVALNNSTSPIPLFSPRHVSLLKPTPSPPQIHHHHPSSAHTSPSSTLDTPSPCGYLLIVQASQDQPDGVPDVPTGNSIFKEGEFINSLLYFLHRHEFKGWNLC